MIESKNTAALFVPPLLSVVPTVVAKDIIFHCDGGVDVFKFLYHFLLFL